MRFFTGLHQPSDAQHFEAAFVSINRINRRKGPFAVTDWIMDSGAFTTVNKYGGYPSPEEEYAAQIIRWSKNGNMLAAVAQDYMCEADVLKRTGMTIGAHQTLTLKRYGRLRWLVPKSIHIMPVLQGYSPADYVAHIRMYGHRLKPGMWVGVGSVCKRNGNVRAIEAVLLAIKQERPDLKLHGFGLKTTALSSELVRSLLETSDSMAWSYAARRQNRNPNDWREAKLFGDRIEASKPIPSPQRRLDFM